MRRIQWMCWLSMVTMIASSAIAGHFTSGLQMPQTRRFRCEVEMLLSEESDGCETWVVLSGGVTGAQVLTRASLLPGDRKVLDVAMPDEIPAGGTLGLWVMPGRDRNGHEDRVRWWGPELVEVDPARPGGLDVVADLAQVVLSGGAMMLSGERRLMVPTGPTDVPLAVVGEAGVVIGAAAKAGAGVVMSLPSAWTGGEYRTWRGMLHAHSDLSDGAGSPEVAFRQARTEGMDFFAVTDHAEMLRIPRFGKGRWATLLEMADGASIPGEFVALAGFEYTHPIDGHVNVFGARTVIDAVSSPRWTTFLDELAREPDGIGQFNHPGHPGTTDWNGFAIPEYGEGWDAALGQMALIRAEDAQGGFGVAYRKALDQGWRVAPQSSHDDHIASWGRGGASRTGVIASSLSEESVLAAIRSRKVFASSDPGLSVVLWAGDHWMGEAIPRGRTELRVNAWDPVPDDLLARLEVVGTGGRILADTVPERAASTMWKVTVDPTPGESIYVRVVQEDGGEVLSAPLFFGP